MDKHIFDMLRQVQGSRVPDPFSPTPASRLQMNCNLCGRIVASADEVHTAVDPAVTYAEPHTADTPVSVVDAERLKRGYPRLLAMTARGAAWEHVPYEVARPLLDGGAIVLTPTDEWKEDDGG